MSVKFYDTHHAFSTPTPQYTTKIVMADTDTLGAAQPYENACCLNFASHKRPGGGYKAVQDYPGPIKTQEEDLFRRSNLPELMDTLEIRKEYYPLKGVKGLYTTNIVVTKDQCLQPITPFNISLVTVPALVNPQGKEDMEMTREKILRILDIAADNGAKELILGAWGCGVFNNDPHEIATFFCHFLRNDYQGIFETVIFAVPGKNSGNRQRKTNYDVFEQVVGGQN